jgi:hypothetical protein
MTTFPGSPKLLKGGLVLVDPASGSLLSVISLQYNPDSLSRSFQIQAYGNEGGDRSQALRLKGNPVESIKLEAELDASDQLEFPDKNATTVSSGLHAQLAVLETLAYPRSADLLANDRLAGSGTLEVIPIEAPLTLLVWSRSRIVPVRLTELSVTEEAFDPNLNPIRAKVSLGLRVLSVDDLGFAHRGGGIFMSYLQAKEGLAGQASPVTLSALGLETLP